MTRFFFDRYGAVPVKRNSRPDPAQCRPERECAAFDGVPTGKAASATDGSDSAVRPLPDFDIQALIYRANSSFNPLAVGSSVDCRVSQVKDGLTFYELALPSDLSRFFVAFLESMTGFFRLLHVKEKHALSSELSRFKAIDPAVIAERDAFKADYVALVCSTFEDLTSQGRDTNEAIKGTLKALKAVSHPWATYEQVKGCLRSEGLLRLKKRQARK